MQRANRPQTAEELLEERQRRQREREEREKPDFELGTVTPVPGRVAGETPWLKSGHMVCLRVLAKANKQNFRGRLEVELRTPDDEPVPVPGTARACYTRRTVTLSRGQAKQLEVELFVPPTGDSETPSDDLIFSGITDYGVVWCRLLSDGGRAVAVSKTRVSLVGGPQLYCVVLSRVSESYTFLDNLPTFVSPEDVASSSPGPLVVCRYSCHRNVPVPEGLPAWMSTAYVVWDQVDPELLSPEQQTALLDWLHWGGQLVISGPDSLDRLRDSFLAPFLPCDLATGGAATRALGEEDFSEMIETVRPQRGEITELQLDRPVVGSNLQVRRQGQAVPGTGRLVFERNVGRGRVCVTAFPIDHPALVAWNEYDMVVRSVLLRLPPRAFFRDEMRIGYRYRAPNGTSQRASLGAVATASHSHGERAAASLAVSDPQWDDFGPISSDARSWLREASRINVPSRRMIAGALIGYIVLTVPTLWLVFRLAGKPEWAWAALPAVAVIWTLVAVRQSQMNIGFVRLGTEFNVVEFQPGWRRGCATSYVALYSSLATRFHVQSEARHAVLQPFPAVRQPGEFRFALGQTVQRLPVESNGEMALSGFPVDSNSVGMIHAEGMIDAGGSFQLRFDGTNWELHNTTGVTLEEIILLRSEEHTGRLRAAKLARLPAGEAATIRWRDVAEDGVMGTTLALRATPDEPTPVAWELEWSLEHALLSRYLTLANERLAEAPGTVALGLCREDLSPFSVYPVPEQQETATVVIAHLDYHPFPAPQADEAWIQDWRPPPGDKDAPQLRF